MGDEDWKEMLCCGTFHNVELTHNLLPASIKKQVMALAHLIKTIHEPLTKVGLSKSVLVNDVCFLKCENIAMQCVITMHCYSIDSIVCIAEYITSTPAQVKSTNQKENQWKSWRLHRVQMLIRCKRMRSRQCIEVMGFTCFLKC